MIESGSCSSRLSAFFPTSWSGLRLHIGAMVVAKVESAQAIEFMADGIIRIKN